MSAICVQPWLVVSGVLDEVVAGVVGSGPVVAVQMG
jgi:hypothetical protein